MLRHAYAIIVCGMLCASCGLAGGEDREKEARKMASAFMTDYVAARDSLPKTAACWIRGEEWHMQKRQPAPSRSEVLFIWAEDRNRGDYYFAHGRNRVVGLIERPVSTWEQTLKSSEIKLRRQSSADNFDRVVDLSVTDPKPPGPDRPQFDPFQLSVSGYGAYLTGRVDAKYALEAYMLNAKLVHAEHDTGGNVVGVWLMGNQPGVVIDITFNKSFGNMPTRMVRRLRTSGVQDPLEARKGRINEVSQTEWSPKQVGGEQYWLPEKYRMVSMGSGKVDQMFCFKWKIGEAAIVSFPDTVASDWRRPFAELFEEELRFDFDSDSCGATVEGGAIPRE